MSTDSDLSWYLSFPVEVPVFPALHCATLKQATDHKLKYHDIWNMEVREYTNLLLTAREERTAEYWPEVVAVRTERSTKTTEGQYSPVRLELAGYGT